MADGSAIDRLLEHCRASMERVEPTDLEAEVAGGALVIDIRPCPAPRPVTAMQRSFLPDAVTDCPPS